MKPRVLSLLFCAGLSLLMLGPAGFAQRDHDLPGYSTVRRLSGVSDAEVRAAINAGTTIPMWSYSIVSPLDGRLYSGKMVGRSPFNHGARTTSITTQIVPLIINMPDGGVFDPTAPDPLCSPTNTPLAVAQQSPIFQPFNFSFGGTPVRNTQYTDAFQRANFWSNVSVTGDSYHTLMNVATLDSVILNVPVGLGQTRPAPCGSLGRMEINWFDNYLRTTLIPSLAGQGVNPTTFPIFLLYNVVMYIGSPNNCCVLGFHGAFGNPVQTYSPSEYDTSRAFSGGITDASILAHEVGEWMDDPTGNNPTPRWGHIGQVSGCQSNLEVGDPLTGIN